MVGKTSMLSRKTSKRLFTWVSSDQYYNAFIGYLTCRPRQIFLMSFHLWYLKSTTRVKPLKETKSSNNTRANMHPFLTVYIPIQIFWQGLWRIIRECTMSFLCTVYGLLYLHQNTNEPLLKGLSILIAELCLLLWWTYNAKNLHIWKKS